MKKSLFILFISIVAIVALLYTVGCNSLTKGKYHDESISITVKMTPNEIEAERKIVEDNKNNIYSTYLVASTKKNYFGTVKKFKQSEYITLENTKGEIQRINLKGKNYTIKVYKKNE